jgi:hypothetical protein
MKHYQNLSNPFVLPVLPILVNFHASANFGHQQIVVVGWSKVTLWNKISRLKTTVNNIES